LIQLTMQLSRDLIQRKR